ncbi:MAG: hypothetical protein Q8P81_00810 [Nanoarchaeota archaeon]|nr:hypothetical protein [Nanoarchaeota archaeon]
MVKKKSVTLYRAEEIPSKKKSPPSWRETHLEWQIGHAASGRWFTDDLSEAEHYLDNHCANGRIVFINVPEDVAERFKVSNMEDKGGKGIKDNPRAYSLRPEREYFLPADIAEQKKVYVLNESESSRLEGRIGVFGLLIVGGIALSVTSFQTTGNAVSSLVGTPSGFAGLLFFVAGIVGMFFVLKKR